MAGYAGEGACFASFGACTEAVPDPWEVTQAFSRAVGELLLAADEREKKSS